MLFICRIESESSGTAPETRPGREPTTGKQYFPSSGNQPGTAAEEELDQPRKRSRGF